MGMIPRLILLMMILAACSSPPPPERISKERWVECWTLCGKADKLVSATNTACYCAGGVKLIRDGEAKADEPKTEPVQIFKWLTE